MSAADYDEIGTDNNQVVYSVVDGNTDDVFALDATTGALSLVGQVDYETRTRYVLTVSASDLATKKGVFPATSTTTVIMTVTIVDVNDNDPIFASPNINFR